MEQVAPELILARELDADLSVWSTACLFEKDSLTMMPDDT
ncbi:hypothetical protein NBRC116495_27680 [Aurantivibrio plasticivorans]